MEAKKIQIQDFYYNLPTDKIAKYPLETRDSSKLLIYKHKTISGEIQIKDTAKKLKEVL
jgi:S-adenosylmethionine:tRNA ribosyltransferase-isomerase